MTRSIIRRTLCIASTTLVVGVGGAFAPSVTPAASALPPISCAEAEVNRILTEMELKDLQRQLSHLVAGGVTSDEVNYVDATLSRMSALQDDLAYLESILYRCLKGGGPNGSVWRSSLAKLSKLQVKLAKLRADAIRLRASVTAKHG